MNERHPGSERISAYADGELPAEEAGTVERHIERCTECARDLALIRAMGGAMRENVTNPPNGGVWAAVDRRIARPVGWLLVTAGVLVWVALAVVEWFRAGELTLPWLATTAVVIGAALLLAGVGYEQYREWKSSPYKDIEL